MNLLIKANILGVQNKKTGASIPLNLEVSGNLAFKVLHTVQINFHAVDVNKYIYIQTPIGLLIF